MEKARKRVNLCVFVVVLTAIVIGILYYYGEIHGQPTVSDGTLISNLGMEWKWLCQ